jgi:hypothetical protein
LFLGASLPSAFKLGTREKKQARDAGRMGVEEEG